MFDALAMVNVAYLNDQNDVDDDSLELVLELGI